MEIVKYSPENRKTINWAHGTSTELFIHPENGNFQERDFIFRISTATVEAEETAFTYFEGITRHLMILKGDVYITHEGRYTKHLNPFDQDIFSGEWNTTSKGKVTDFNLMLKGNAIGSLQYVSISAHQKIDLPTSGTFCFLFVVSGRIVDHLGNSYLAGDLLKIAPQRHEDFEIRGREDSDLIRISVSVRS